MILKRFLVILIGLFLIVGGSAWAAERPAAQGGETGQPASREGGGRTGEGGQPQSASPVQNDVTAGLNALNVTCNYDQAIMHFTSAIGSGQYKGSQLAQIYYNRSLAYERKGLLGQAVDDMWVYTRLQPRDQKGRQRLNMLKRKQRGSQF